MGTDFNHGHAARASGAISLGVDEYLSHSSGGYDDEGGILNWKRNKDENTGELLAWLHTKAKILAVYRHAWWKVKELEDKDTGEKRTEVFPNRWVCHEREGTLKARKWRFSSKQDRNYPPPDLCPFDHVLEMVFTEVQEGRLSWVEPVFEFRGSDGKSRKTNDVLLHAAGLYGGYGEKNMPPGKVAELRRSAIRRDEVWGEDVRAKVAYLLTVVDNEHPENGPRLVIETEAFKRAFTKAIDDERKRMRRKDDSPMIRPYPLLFTYDKTQDFSDRYSATAMADQPSAEIQALITSDDNIPDTTEYTTVGDPEELLASIEEHALIKLDWGSCFRDPSKAQSAVPVGPKPTPTRATTPSKATVPAASAKAAPAPEAEEEHLFSCEHCGKAAMKVTDYECPVCHATYVDAKDADEQPIVVLATRPCTKCGTAIEFGESPSEVGKAGENVICTKCGTIHREVMAARTERPCENPDCKAMVALDAEAPCTACGKEHGFGEDDPQDAPAEVIAWEAVQPVVEPAKPKAAPVRRPGARPAVVAK